jgi:RiboL-PSP-HEPN
MPEPFVYRQSLQQLDSIIQRMRHQEDDFIIAQIAQHICVRLSGTLENALKENISRALGPSSHPRAMRYIDHQLGDFQNPRPGKIVDLLAAFDRTWSDQLQTFWEPEVKDAIASIVGQRNIIAHGGSTNVTLVRVQEWFKNVKAFCVFLEQLR